jgi:hypothetical protein
MSLRAQILDLVVFQQMAAPGETAMAFSLAGLTGTTVRPVLRRAAVRKSVVFTPARTSTFSASGAWES